MAEAQRRREKRIVASAMSVCHSTEGEEIDLVIRVSSMQAQVKVGRYHQLTRGEGCASWLVGGRGRAETRRCSRSSFVRWGKEEGAILRRRGRVIVGRWSPEEASAGVRRYDIALVGTSGGRRFMLERQNAWWGTLRRRWVKKKKAKRTALCLESEIGRQATTNCKPDNDRTDD